MKKLALSVFIISVLLACEERVKFEVPQPSGKHDLNQIPSKLQGTYYSTADDVLLTITETQIIEWNEWVAKSLVDSLDFKIDFTLMDELTSDSVRIIEGKYKLTLKFLPSDTISSAINSMRMNGKCLD